MKRAFFLGLVLASASALLGCPNKTPPPVFDAGAPVTVIDAGPVDASTDLTPLPDDDAGLDAGPDASRPVGPVTPPLQSKVMACCRSLHARAKEQGNAPEILAIAGQCDAIANGLGSGGAVAPELVPLKLALKGVSLGGVPGCTGF